MLWAFEDSPMNKHLDRVRLNVNEAKAMWGRLSRTTLDGLKELTLRYAFSVALRDLQLLDDHWYVTGAGLLRLADRRHCAGIKVQRVREICDPAASRWVFKAIVYKNTGSKGFVGFGDANPSNVSPMVRGAEMRVAETRAVNRALRKAYGIGLCSVEELGSLSDSLGPTRSHEQSTKPHPQNGLSNGQPRLRDRLCLLMSLFSFADAAIWEIKDSTRSRLAPLRVSVPQKSAAYALTRVGSRLYWRMVWSASSIPMLNQWR